MRRRLPMPFIIIITVLACLSPLVFFLPAISGDNKYVINNNSIILNGPYSRAIPFSQIEKIEYDSPLPKISYRSNGISIGRINIGHFKSKGGGEVMLYLHSSKPTAIYVLTKDNKKVYINFKDENYADRFINDLKNSCHLGN